MLRFFFQSIINKPEYWYRPNQLFRRVQIACRHNSPNTLVNVNLPWGVELAVNPHETIGRSLLTLGVYELSVSESLWRLTDVGDLCVDIGANIGYMTSLLARRAGESGSVLGFEPHPKIFARLEENILNNVAGKGKQFFAPVTLNQSALGITDGKVELFEPDGFRDNEGIAFLANTTRQPTAKGISYSVDLRRLDSFFHSDTRFGTVKIDVEGAEFEVLRGAEMLLSKRSIRDIVFEDFQPFPSETSILLLDYGYRIYRLVKTIFGPVLWDMLDPGVKYNLLPWEPVNYLATLDPDRALIRFRQKGWLCLRRFPLR